jgi:DNA-binding MarR family transcriptional regulator
MEERGSPRGAWVVEDPLSQGTDGTADGGRERSTGIDDYPALDDDGLARILIRCAYLVRARMDVVLAPLDLSYSGFAVLEQLEVTPNLRQADLGRRLGVRRQAVHRTVGSLARAGLVFSAPAFGDHRSRVYRLTEPGAVALMAGRRAAAGVEGTIVRQLADPSCDFDVLVRDVGRSGDPPRSGYAVREEVVGPLERLAARLERLREWETYLGRPLERPPEPWWFIPDRRSR